MLGLALKLFGVGAFFYGMFLYGSRISWGNSFESPYRGYLLASVPEVVLVGAVSAFGSGVNLLYDTRVLGDPKGERTLRGTSEVLNSTGQVDAFVISWQHASRLPAKVKSWGGPRADVKCAVIEPASSRHLQVGPLGGHRIEEIRNGLLPKRMKMRPLPLAEL